MKKFVVVISIVTLCIGLYPFPNCFAQPTDHTGVWKFTLSDSTIKGMCPMGNDGTGSLSILAKGNGNYTIKFLKDMACNPANVCVLKGTCNDSKCNFTTTVTVDNEGGKVTNSAKLRFDGNHATGSGMSVYKHPAMQCSWSYLLMLTK